MGAVSREPNSAANFQSARSSLNFACIQHKLVVELDGGQHAESATDKKRDEYLAANGWRVLRFWNNDVTGNRDGVLERIFQAVSRS